MSQKIDLEQLASFLKDRKKDRRKKQKKKKKKKFKLVVLDGRQETQTRSGIVNKLGIQENVTDARKEPAYDKLKKRAEGGSLNLIYALQKDVKDIQNRFMGGAIQPQQTPFSPVPRVKPQQLTAQGFQDRNASFDLAIKAQTEAREIKKNQDRIEKEAKAEVKRLEAEAKAEVKRLEKEAKEEQARARAEQKALVKEQTKINKELEKQLSEQEKQLSEQELKDEEVKRLLNARERRERAKEKKQSTITNYTIAQGIRTFTDFAPNPPDIGGGGGLPPLPFNRQRDQYDPLEPAPFYRSTADRIEAPVLQEVLDSFSAPPADDSAVAEEFPTGGEDESMDFMTDEGLLGGGASEMTTSDVTGGDVTTTGEALEEETPAKKKVVVSGEPIVVSGKKKGRPAGSKNKPKPPPSEPSQIARLGGSSVVGRTPKGKTPANSPSVNTPSGSAV
jgi:hypothetical protein